MQVTYWMSGIALGKWRALKTQEIGEYILLTKHLRANCSINSLSDSHSTVAVPSANQEGMVRDVHTAAHSESVRDDELRLISTLVYILMRFMWALKNKGILAVPAQTLSIVLAVYTPSEEGVTQPLTGMYIYIYMCTKRAQPIIHLSIIKWERCPMSL